MKFHFKTSSPLPLFQWREVANAGPNGTLVRREQRIEVRDCTDVSIMHFMCKELRKCEPSGSSESSSHIMLMLSLVTWNTWCSTRFRSAFLDMCTFVRTLIDSATCSITCMSGLYTSMSPLIISTSAPSSSLHCTDMTLITVKLPLLENQGRDDGDVARSEQQKQANSQEARSQRLLHEATTQKVFHCGYPPCSHKPEHKS